MTLPMDEPPVGGACPQHHSARRRLRDSEPQPAHRRRKDQWHGTEPRCQRCDDRGEEDGSGVDVHRLARSSLHGKGQCDRAGCRNSSAPCARRTWCPWDDARSPPDRSRAARTRGSPSRAEAQPPRPREPSTSRSALLASSRGTWAGCPSRMIASIWRPSASSRTASSAPRESASASSSNASRGRGRNGRAALQPCCSPLEHTAVHLDEVAPPRRAAARTNR